MMIMMMMMMNLIVFPRLYGMREYQWYSLDRKGSFFLGLVKYLANLYFYDLKNNFPIMLDSSLVWWLAYLPAILEFPVRFPAIP